VTTYPPPVTSPSWSPRSKRTVVLVSLFVVAFLAWRLTEILPIIVIALVVAYLLMPLARFLDRRVLHPNSPPRRSQSAIAIILTFLIVLLFFAFVGIVVFPVIFEQMQEFLNRLPGLVDNILAQVQVVLSRPILIAGQEIVPFDSIQEALGGAGGTASLPSLTDLNLPQTMTSFVRSLSGPAFSFLGGAVNAVINFIFLLTLLFYLMKDGAVFVDRMVNFAPNDYRSDARRLFYELGQVWDAYLRGQVLLSVIMGVTVFIAAVILGVPNAPILGMLSALLEFIPTLGPALALIPAALLAVGSQSSTLPFLEGVPFMLTVIVVWTLLQNVEAVLLVPRIMGDSLNLHPFVVMIGVLAGAAVGGALGVILAAPVIASLRVFGQYIYGKLADVDPFPPPPPPGPPQPSLFERVRRMMGARSAPKTRKRRVMSK
jgi:predicted PurR-regulated permease PerM